MNYDDMLHAIRDRAVALLEIGWTQKALAVYTNGDVFGPVGGENPLPPDHETPTREEGACGWCASGAIHAAITELNEEQGWFDAQDQEEEDEYGTLWNSLSSRWSTANPCNAEEGLVSFNDKEGVTQEDVIQSLRNINRGGNQGDENHGTR